MIRLLISVLCALGLAFAAVTADAAAMAGSIPGCTMGKMPAKNTDHGKMDCCTPACQLTASAALLPNSSDNEATSQPHRLLFGAAPVKKLGSVPTTGLDPPPRA